MNITTSESDALHSELDLAPTDSMVHKAMLSDYDWMLSHLDTAGISLTQLATVLMAPHPHSPLTPTSARDQRLLAPLLKLPAYRKHCHRLEANPDTLVLTRDRTAVEYKVTSLDGKKKIVLNILPDQFKETISLAHLTLSEDENGEGVLAAPDSTIINLVATINLKTARIEGVIRADGQLSLVQFINYYGIAPWDPAITKEHQARVNLIKEKRACLSLQLGTGIDISACRRSPTDEDKEFLANLKLASPTNPITLEGLVAINSDNDIIKTVKRFLPATEKSLFHYLKQKTSPTITVENEKNIPTVCLESILRSAESTRLGTLLLKSLNWYGGEADEDTGEQVRTKLVSRAICLWTTQAVSGERNDIAGFQVHQRSQRGNSYHRLRARFEQHLFDNHHARTMPEARVLARLFQPEFPKEFQVHDIPSDLPYRGSIVWVNFVHGVTLAEAIEDDLITRMTFQQLVNFPILLSMTGTQEERELIGLCRIAPALQWAITHGIIHEKTDSDYSKEDVDCAIEALDAHADALSSAIAQMDVDYPLRSVIADENIKKFFKDRKMFALGEWRTVREGSSTPFVDDGRKLIEDFSRGRKGGLIGAPDLRDKAHSFRDVYMSLKWTKGRDWHITTKDGLRPSKHTLRINADGTLTTTSDWIDEATLQKSLPDVNESFQSEFDSYLKKSKSAYETLLKNLFLSLPYDIRLAMEHGAVKIYTLRKPTSDLWVEHETPTKILPLRLRMGFILQATLHDKQYHIECLPRAGIIRERSDITTAMLGGHRTFEYNPGFFHDEMEVLRPLDNIPIDWDAHETGTPPQAGKTCNAIIDQFGQTFTPPPPSLNSERSPSPKIANARAFEVAHCIANNFFYYDEKLLLDAARGETEIERFVTRPHWTESLKKFLPFWGGISDLQSDDPNQKAWAVFGLIFDVVSFAMPLGKFISGSIKLVSTAVRSGIAYALPKLGKLASKLLISSVQNTIPFYGLPTTAFRLTRGLVRGAATGIQYAATGLKYIVRKSVAGIKNSMARSSHYSTIGGWPQITNPARWTPLTPNDRLAAVRGLQDVPVRNIGSTSTPRYYLIDPVSAKPYGPALRTAENELSEGPSIYPAVAKNSDDALFIIPNTTRARYIPEVDGRTTVYLDDIPYRLDDEVLRRVSLIDDSKALQHIPCRAPRAPAETVCVNSFVNATAAPTPAPGSVDETKGYALWFGERRSTPQTWRGEAYLALDDALYRVTNNVPRLVREDLKTLGFNQSRLIPKKAFIAPLEFRKGIYARLEIPGTYEQIDDIHRVGAIIATSIDETAIHVFTRVNSNKYYLATVAKGNSLSGSLKFNLLTKAQMADGELGAELLRVYTGSLLANNVARLHGVKAVERALKTMEEIAIPLGTPANPANNMKWLKVDTSPAEALMFDHSTRMIVTRLPEGATNWTRSAYASQPFRQRTAEVLDNLFLSPLIRPRLADPALRIQDTMEKLQGLMPRYQRPVNARNIAFADVTTSTGQREIYVSVSGGQRSTTFLPLFRRLGANQVKQGNATYFNIDFNQTFPRTNIRQTPDGKILAVPLTIKDIKTYKTADVTKPTSLDSESKLISVIRGKYPDPAQIRSIEIVTTMRPCESCSVVMQQFGHDGGREALKVLWG